ncbi:winged helix-turn-helix domain-containing protein [Mycolicibacterium sphagni]|uniref:Response regulator transcription factor n=1 Tax=Mycolicibacterium sphagni TaxID=1786 RepID=A0ABX2JS73_9MYCO|nr:response regulator transcription factor [Mycolicibacterium sphagni]
MSPGIGHRPARVGTETARIVIVEQRTRGCGLLGSILEVAGHPAETTADSFSAQDLLLRNHVDLLLVDVDATGSDPATLIDQFRYRSATTALVLVTESDDVEPKVAALRAGADDYITKPFHPSELVARLEAILRRLPCGTGRELRYAGLSVDLDRLIVTRDEQRVTLTPNELRLAILLLENAERVVSRSQILDRVWQYNFKGESLIIEKVVSNLRKKIDRESEPLIQTIRGFGYTLRRAHH